MSPPREALGSAFAFQTAQREREWRTWERPEHVEVYRKTPNSAYYEHRHDRDPDMGWRVR